MCLQKETGSVGVEFPSSIFHRVVPRAGGLRQETSVTAGRRASGVVQ